MDTLLLTNIHKSFDKRILLQNVEFECKVGQIIGVLGRNGCGKSTLLKMIFGTEKADTIGIKINSKVYTPKEIIPSRRIGYLPQVTFLPKDIMVRDIISVFFPNGELQDLIFYAPKVSSFETTKVGNLSLGQLRYLELLLMGNLPHTFLLLDEPFSMIEPLYKEVIKEFLIELKNSKGIILTDHYYNDVLEITTKNYVITDAQIVPILDKADLVFYVNLRSYE